jgi:hypothetical protein
MCLLWDCCWVGRLESSRCGSVSFASSLALLGWASSLCFLGLLAGRTWVSIEGVPTKARRRGNSKLDARNFFHTSISYSLLVEGAPRDEAKGGFCNEKFNTADFQRLQGNKDRYSASCTHDQGCCQNPFGPCQNVLTFRRLSKLRQNLCQN